MDYYRISQRAHLSIRKFYTNVARKYCHTYSIELMQANIADAINNMSRIEHGLLRRKPTITRWHRYFMANCNKWYYAYTLSNDKQGKYVITIVDACHSQNMHEHLSRTAFLQLFERRHHARKSYNLVH